VEAHKALAAQEGRLDLLLQQLADKEVLLEQARQLVSPTRPVLLGVILLAGAAGALLHSTSTQTALAVCNTTRAQGILLACLGYSVGGHSGTLN
jgi:hypothetical protein